MKYISKYKSPLGDITLASDGEKLTALWFDGQKYDRKGLSKNPLEKDLEIFEMTKKWLDLYFKGENPDFKIPISFEGSDFRKEVLEILQEIPYGKTMTYGEIGKILAQKRNKKSMSAQAVGGAVGHNPISIIIPCHRVLGKGGYATGYAGGIDKKLALLKLEGVDTSKISLKK